MAIPAQNATYINQGPTASGQVFAPNELSNLENAIIGTATFVLDGTLTSAVLNFIDGTKTLSFTPTAIEAQTIGGTQLPVAAVAVQGTAVTDNTKGTIYFSGAGTSANTVKILFKIVK
jgi:hypothetical protein